MEIERERQMNNMIKKHRESTESPLLTTNISIYFCDKSKIPLLKTKSKPHSRPTLEPDWRPNTETSIDDQKTTNIFWRPQQPKPCLDDQNPFLFTTQTAHWQQKNRAPLWTTNNIHWRPKQHLLYWQQETNSIHDQKNEPFYLRPEQTSLADRKRKLYWRPK